MTGADRLRAAKNKAVVFSKALKEGGDKAAFGTRRLGRQTKAGGQSSEAEAESEQPGQGRLTRQERNRALAVAFGTLVLDAIFAITFCMLAPTDPRLASNTLSRRQKRTVYLQKRTVYLQNFVALVDAIVSTGLIVHVVQGILIASLDNFLEAAVAKLLQAIFFSLLQTGYPTTLRLFLVTVLLLLRGGRPRATADRARPRIVCVSVPHPLTAAPPRKLQACEHNAEETRDACEDMHFQITQNRKQQENSLAVLSGEVNYLNEHAATVQRKASELKSRSAEVELAIVQAGHAVERTKQANALAIADKSSELDHLRGETAKVEERFAAVREDVRVLYQDKLGLHRQLAAARAEATDVESTVGEYRKRVAHLVEE